MCMTSDRLQLWSNLILEWSPACLYVGCMCGFFWLLSQKMFPQSCLYVFMSVINPRKSRNVVSLWRSEAEDLLKNKTKKKHLAFILKASLWIKSLEHANGFAFDGDDNEETFTTHGMDWTLLPHSPQYSLMLWLLEPWRPLVCLFVFFTNNL